MKYKIKIETFRSGRQEFTAFVKQWGLWFNLDCEGKTSLLFASCRSERIYALEYIDFHRKGNNKSHSITFDYIEI